LVLAKQPVIFDIEGTLIDCVPQSLMCWREAFASCGYEFSIEELHRHSGRDPDEMIRLLLPEAAAGALAEQLKKTQGRCYRERFLNDVKPFPGVRALFSRIKRTGAITALATTCSSEEMRHYCRVAEISELVDHAACGEDVAQDKPHPDLIKLVLSRAKVAPGDAVMVGDTPYDAQAGRRASVLAVGLMSGGFKSAELEAAGCAAVYTDPAALLKAFETVSANHELEP
jgi:beta-phosphoglucomutase-like phosphatase (HAD superfamily)